MREVKTFLGMTGFYRRFVPGYATIAKPLTSLLQNGRLFQWSPQCGEAFASLKQKLSCAPVLTHPSTDRESILTKDASTVGIDAELAQETNDKRKPVVYFSRALFKAERKYSTYDQEFFCNSDSCPTY